MATASSITDNEISRNSRQEQCKRLSEFYHDKFPTIPTMSSEDLIRRQQQQTSNERILLVDVRTTPERHVSVIPGSVSLDSLQLQNHQQPTAPFPPETTVVTYCTIGYRSGLEARRLLDQHPELEGRIYNLDGILMYSHVGELVQGDTTSTTNPSTSYQANPQQQQTQPTATQVHTFGKIWEPCANQERYQPVFYGFPFILARFIQVGALSVLRGTQRLGFLCSLSFAYCCPPWRERDVVEKHH